MTSHYHPFPSNGLADHQGQTFDHNFMDSMIQQHIEQQHTLSPSTAESHGSAYSSSPARTPTMATQQQASPQPYATQLSPGNYFGSKPINVPRSTTSPVGQYTQPLSGASGLTFGLSMGMDGAMQDGSAMFGHGTTPNSASLNNYRVGAPRRQRASVGQNAAHLQLSLPQYSTPQIQAPVNASLPPPTIPSVPPRSLTSRSRQSNEFVMGHIMVNKKFKCAQSECKDLTFGRLADLRRHYEQTHARNRHQFYCPYAGCSRSHAETGGKGRSFGTRKDKRDEHIRNVHEKDQRSHDPTPVSQYSPSGSL